MTGYAAMNFSLPDTSSALSYSTRLHLNTFVSLVSNFLALYLIVFHSSKSISTYKWCLFNIVLTLMLLDLHTTVMFQPMVFYPSPMVCIIGVARHLPDSYGTVVQLLIFTFLFGCCIGASFTAFLYRLLAIYGRAHLLRRPVAIFALVVVHATATAPCIWGFSQTFEHSDITIEEGYPCMVRVTMLGNYVMGAEAVFWTVELFVQPTLTFYRLEKERRKISFDTYKAQRALLISLSVQVFLPVATMALPIMLITLSDHFGLTQAAAIGQIAFQLVTLHSFMNAVAMIALTKPYRDTVCRWLRAFTRLPGASVSTISSTHANSQTRSNGVVYAYRQPRTDVRSRESSSGRSLHNV